jgi:thioredoxin-like negative regulator of GroEL
LMNQLMQRFGGMGGGAPAAPQGPTEPELGQVFQVGNLAQLQKLIKETPGLIVDFWSPTCPPCMRIKPTFESAAKANDNPNLVFAAVNTSQARDCGGAFQVTAIPNFIAFEAGKQFKNFKGANEQMLFATIGELSDKIPKGKVSGAKGHDQMAFKQFKPSHLAP